MSPDRFARVSEVLLAARAHPENERAAYLNDICGADVSLRREVESLLQADRRPAPRIQLPRDDARSFVRIDSLDADDLPGAHSSIREMVGRYRIVRVLGEGGMGIVYEAEQSDPHRTVALKAIRSSVASGGLIRRLVQEAKILAQLKHPGIAHIYEVGAAEMEIDGRGIKQPFLAMEFIDGEPLTHHARRLRLTARARLELLALVCDAVQHAHQRGVIHRDLKPGNILVSNDGVPKVLDFGVARLLGSNTQTLQTNPGQLVGTLAYMSPEQVSGDPEQLDTRSDIYSLGAVLFELLGGRLPFEVGDCSIPEAIRRISQEAPPRLTALNRSLDGEIETIVNKALARDKSRRYQSAAEFSEDIRRYLRDEPIAAKRDSALYVLRKAARRYRWGLVGASAFALLLGGFSVYIALQLRAYRELAEREGAARAAAQDSARAATTARVEADQRRAETENARLAAQREAEHARAVTGYLVETLGLANPDITQQPDITVRQLLERASSEIGDSFAAEPVAEIRIRTVIGRAYAALGEPVVAREHLERALVLQTELLPDEFAIRYEILWPLCQALADVSEMADAQRDECALIGVRLLARTYPHLATAMTELIQLPRGPAGESAASTLRASATEMARRALPEDDPAWVLIGDQYYLRGYRWGLEGRARLACEYLRAALDIYRRTLPETHTSIVRALGRLIAYEIDAGGHEQAEAAALEAIDLLRQTLPEDHWYVTLYQARRGGCLIGQGRYDEAEALLLNGHARIAEATGRTGRYVAENLRHLIRLYHAMDRSDLANARRPELAAAITGSPEYGTWIMSPLTERSVRLAFGPEAAAMIEALDRLAAEVRVPTAAASETIAGVIEVRRKLFEDEDPLSAAVADVCHTYARFYARHPGSGPGVLNLREDVARVARCSAALHPRKRAEMLSALASLYAPSQPASAESVLQEALTVLRNGSVSDQHVFALQAQLGLLLIRQNRNQEAEPSLVAAYDGLRKSAGRTARGTREALRDLVTCYERLSRTDKLMELASLRLQDLLSPPAAPASELASASWQVAANTGLPAETYELARRAAERAVELSSSTAHFHYILAACQYRLDDFSLALHTLTAAGRLPGDLHGADWAFTAMAHAQLGHWEDAETALRPLRERVASMGKHEFSNNHKLLREAEETLAACRRRDHVGPP